MRSPRSPAIRNKGGKDDESQKDADKIEMPTDVVAVIELDEFARLVRSAIVSKAHVLLALYET